MRAVEIRALDGAKRNDDNDILTALYLGYWDLPELVRHKTETDRNSGRRIQDAEVKRSCFTASGIDEAKSRRAKGVKE